MAIGYEGYVKVCGNWALGTGSSIPNNRQRMDSAGAYRGTVAGANIGIGYARNYDWTAWDGSVDVEMTQDVFAALKGWIVGTRDTFNSIAISSRNANSQVFSQALWNAINFSASEGAMVTASVGFAAMSRASYVYGSDDPSKLGSGSSILLLEPIPYWYTQVGSYKFITWSLDFSQDVVKFFACNRIAGPQAPAYYGVGPMTVTLAGACILAGDEFDDDPGDIIVSVGTGSITLKDLELQTQSDDVQTGNALTPITVSMDAYGLA